MRPKKILEHIDNTIVERINSGHRWSDIINYLKENIIRYKRRDGYIQVSERYLINNWDKIEWKKRMTTMLVIQSMRRISDLNWISDNHHRFQSFSSLKMFRVVQFKDKLLYNKSSESSSSESSISSNS